MTATAESLVHVTSTTKRTFAPDVARVAIGIQGEHDTREACTAEFNERYEAVCRGLLGAGVEASAITTENFHVTMRQQSLYLPWEHGGGYYWCKNVADGYEYRGDLQVKLPADPDLVGGVWIALNDCGEGVTFTITYGLADTDAARTELMGRAVEEALAKARALAAGTGKDVGEVRTISFGSDFGGMPAPMEYGVRSAKMFAMAEDCADGGAPSLEPRAIEISCQVSVACRLV